MSIRVVAWGTGNVGRHALAGIDARPDLELVGLWVSNPAKVGKDAGRLAGLDRDLGVLATNDVEEVLALKPDCVVNCAMADDRLFEAIADLERLLEAGINVVSSGPVFLQYPSGPAIGMSEGVQKAALAGGVSLFVNGIDPGFANDWLPLSLTAISERIDQVRCLEILNYNTYDQGMIVFDVMGFGKPMDNIPMLLEPGILTMAWGSVVHQIAAGLGVELDEVEESYERLPATETFDIDSGTIEEGTVAGLRFEVRGMVGGKAWSCSSTSRASTTTSAPTGRSLPARAVTASRSGASPTTRSTSSCSAPTATTTPPASRPPRCGSSTRFPPSSTRSPAWSRHSTCRSSPERV